MQLVCEIILATTTFVALTIGMIQDVKTRYTSNKIWLGQGGFGFLTILVCGLLNPFQPLELIGIFLNIAFALFFGFLFFYMGAWGAGDSKALFALGFSSPVVFSFISADIPPEMGLIPLFLIILNFIVSIFIILFLIVGLNLWNRKRFGSWFNETTGGLLQKMVLLLTSYQVKPQNLSSHGYLDPVESYEESWKIEFSIFEDYNEEDEILEAREVKHREEVKSYAEQTGRSYVWVRPQIPGIAVFWLSYVIWLMYGSIGVPLLQNLFALF